MIKEKKQNGIRPGLKGLSFFVTPINHYVGDEQIKWYSNHVQAFNMCLIEYVAIIYELSNAHVANSNKKWQEAQKDGEFSLHTVL